MTTAPRSPSSPGSFCAIAPADRRSTLNVPIKFTRRTISNGCRLAGPFLPTVRSAQPTPAHETAKRTPPNASTVPSTAAFTSSSAVTSALNATPPSSSASALAASSFRSAMATRAPRSASARAVAAPRREAPPATIVPASLRSMRPGTLSGRCEREPEHAGRVGEERLELHARLGQLAGEHVERELGAHLGADRLAGGNRDLQAGARDPHVLLGPRPQPHLDPRRLQGEDRLVLEGVEVEVRVELPVQNAQHVEVEACGEACRVVVCGLDHSHVLQQVRAEQE